MKPFLTICIFFLSLCAWSQSAILSKKVTLRYDEIRLQAALDDISERYQIQFSYSSDIIPVRQRVSANVENVPLSAGLDALFSKTKITYAAVGSHIVLKIDENKNLGSIESGKQGRKKKPKPETEEQVLLVSTETPLPPLVPVSDRDAADTAATLESPEIQVNRADGKMHPFDETLLNFEKWRTRVDWQTRKPGGEKRIAQVSVLPFVGTNLQNSHEVTNNVSMNLLWGVNGGVDGMEIGGMVNMVKRDVKGFQIGGIGNTVARNVTGTQIGGLFNYTGGTTRGFQAAGIVNFSRQAEAAQAAGMVNWVQGDVAGFQASGLMNLTGGSARAVQAAGIFNFNKGDAKVQIGGVFNVAKDVEIGQAAGLVNVAREVKGFQIGILNISDTVSGVPIGLINIVKRGYNKFDIYAGEILHGNFQLKLGAKAFYNIFHVGARYPEGGGKYAWGMGYGIGAVSMVSLKNHLNFELMAIHVSENETWTNRLNSIGQFRFLWNHQLGKSIGFFLGPTANVMISQQQDPETGVLGSPLVPYVILDEKFGERTSLKGWVGVNAGFRF